MAESFVVPVFSSYGIVPNSRVAFGRQRSGLLVAGRSNHQPYWGGPIRTGKLYPYEYAALYEQLHDGIERNLRFDLLLPRFRVPRAYTADTWPLEADPTIEAVTDLYTLSVAGLQVGMTLRRGDRLTIVKGELRCHRMIRGGDVTVASATAQAIPLTPRLPIGVFEADDVVKFIDPVLRVAIVPGSIDMPEEYRPTGGAFEVTEALA